MSKMVHVKVILTGLFKDLVGADNVKVEINQPTVAGLIAKMVDRYGSKFRNAVLRGTELNEGVTILVNDSDIEYINGFETTVEEGSTVTIMGGGLGGG